MRNPCIKGSKDASWRGSLKMDLDAFEGIVSVSGLMLLVRITQARL